MKLQSPYFVPVVTLVSGIALTWLAGRQLDTDPRKNNPMAIRQSGYGMTLARLSQDTVNRVWHIGVEEVDHHDHCDCAKCSHNHAEPAAVHAEPDHDHADPAHDHAEDDHDHAEHDHDHAEHDHDHAEHDHDIAEHNHDDHHDHEHCAICNAGLAHNSGPGVVERTNDHIKELAQAKNKRTSKYGLTAQHRLTTSREIENTLRNSYRMDPTNYGVYNAYYLFLTVHDLGATEAAMLRSEEISHQTIEAAFRETENPEAYLTAASAALNLFFTEQGKLKMEGKLFSKQDLVRHGGLIADCLREYDRISQQREIDGTWDQIPVARRAEIIERARFARKTQEQFGVMMARLPEEETGVPATSLVKTKTNETEGITHE